MSKEKIVEINKNFEKNVFYHLKFLNFQNKINIEFEKLNKKIDTLNKKINEQHLENIRSDEILLQHLENRYNNRTILQHCNETTLQTVEALSNSKTYNQ